MDTKTVDLTIVDKQENTYECEIVVDYSVEITWYNGQYFDDIYVQDAKIEFLNFEDAEKIITNGIRSVTIKGFYDFGNKAEEIIFGEREDFIKEVQSIANLDRLLEINNSSLCLDFDIGTIRRILKRKDLEDWQRLMWTHAIQYLIKIEK